MAGFSVITSICFTVNYVVGAGSLTLPWAFQEAGCALGVVMLAIMSFFSISAVLFLLETMARAEAYTSRFRINNNRLGAAEDTEVLIQEKDLIIDELMHSVNGIVQPYVVKERKFEISELCSIFLGSAGKTWYTFIICVYMYGTLWVFATVFSNALASHFNIGEYSYHVFLLLYCAIVVPVSCMELHEQVTVQVTLSVCRLFMIFIMIGTILAAYLSHTQPFAEYGPSLDQSSLSSVHLSKLYILLPVTAYANIFHHSIPNLSHPVHDKRKLRLIFCSTILFCFIAYSLIGCVISSYFGDHVSTSSNLNWRSYSAVTPTSPSVVAALIAGYVVCFPALDVASAFPLCTITLGNNMLSSFYGENAALFEKSRFHRVLFRLIAALPPILGATFVSDLGQIAHFTGISGFVLAFVFPALLALQSSRLLLKRGLSPVTHYSSLITHDFNANLTLALGVFLVVFVVISLIVAG